MKCLVRGSRLSDPLNGFQEGGQGGVPRVTSPSFPRTPTCRYPLDTWGGDGRSVGIPFGFVKHCIHVDRRCNFGARSRGGVGVLRLKVSTGVGRVPSTKVGQGLGLVRLTHSRPDLPGSPTGENLERKLPNCWSCRVSSWPSRYLVLHRPIPPEAESGSVWEWGRDDTGHRGRLLLHQGKVKSIIHRIRIRVTEPGSVPVSLPGEPDNLCHLGVCRVSNVVPRCIYR